MSEQASLWQRLLNGADSRRWLDAAAQRMANSLSDMIERRVSSAPPDVQTIAIAQVATRVGDPEIASVGVYLPLKGQLSGWAALILPLNFALNLVDLLNQSPAGSATSLGEAERSALAEIGNLAVSAFLNAIAALAQTAQPLRPDAPAVVVDMLGVILNLMIAPPAAGRDRLLVIETLLQDSAQAVQIRLWLSPDPGLPIALNRGLS